MSNSKKETSFSIITKKFSNEQEDIKKMLDINLDELLLDDIKCLIKQISDVNFIGTIVKQGVDTDGGKIVGLLLGAVDLKSKDMDQDRLVQFEALLEAVLEAIKIPVTDKDSGFVKAIQLIKNSPFANEIQKMFAKDDDLSEKLAIAVKDTKRDAVQARPARGGTPRPASSALFNLLGKKASNKLTQKIIQNEVETIKDYTEFVRVTSLSVDFIRDTQSSNLSGGGSSQATKECMQLMRDLNETIKDIKNSYKLNEEKNRQILRVVDSFLTSGRISTNDKKNEDVMKIIGELNQAIAKTMKNIIHKYENLFSDPQLMDVNNNAYQALKDKYPTTNQQNLKQTVVASYILTELQNVIYLDLKSDPNLKKQEKDVLTSVSKAIQTCVSSPDVFAVASKGGLGTMLSKDIQNHGGGFDAQKTMDDLCQSSIQETQSKQEVNPTENVKK